MSFEIGPAVSAALWRDTGGGFQSLTGSQILASAPSAYGLSSPQKLMVSSSFRGLFYGDPSVGFVNGDPNVPFMTSAKLKLELSGLADATCTPLYPIFQALSQSPVTVRSMDKGVPAAMLVVRPSTRRLV